MNVVCPACCDNALVLCAHLYFCASVLVHFCFASLPGHVSIEAFLSRVNQSQENEESQASIVTCHDFPVCLQLATSKSTLKQNIAIAHQ